MKKKLITKSIQQFQKGENSDGKNLINTSTQLHDTSYTSAIENFIKEEQNHSKALGTFMDLHSIERIQKHPLDFIFKTLLHTLGIGGNIITLTTAEMISMVYYDALKKATNSKLLQDICVHILEDEVEHLKFQSCSIATIYKSNFIRNSILSFYHSFLIRCTILVVWFFHKDVLKAGGIKNITIFYERVMTEYYTVKLNAYRNLISPSISMKTA